MTDTVNAIEFDTTEVSADRERFRIEDDSQATWAMRKAAAARTRLDEIKAIADAEIERIQAWAEHESREPMRDIDYFEGILTEYAIAQRAEGRKTISTPYGSVKSRMGRAKYVVEDAEAFFEWARQNRPQFIRVKEEPDLTAIREFVPANAGVDRETGELIPGLRVEPSSPSYTVEVSK